MVKISVKQENELIQGHCNMRRELLEIGSFICFEKKNVGLDKLNFLRKLPKSPFFNVPRNDFDFGIWKCLHH